MTEAAEPETDWGCYRHPYEAAGVKCTRCDRPICPKCMITAPVGFQCPECVKGAAPVRRYSDVRRASTGASAMPVTIALIAVNAAIFLYSLRSDGGSAFSGNYIVDDYGLFGPLVDAGEWYRLITAGFLHYGPIHVFFNMMILYQLGQLLEPAFGRLRFGVLYFTALVGGSVGALIVTPKALTAGASGAVFGLMGVAAIAMHRRGINIMQTGIGSLLVINLLLTFFLSNVSIGGHIGGLAAGAVGGLIVLQTEDRPAVGAALVAALGVVLLGVGLAIAAPL